VQGWAVDVPEALPYAAEVDALSDAVHAALPEERRVDTAVAALEKGGTLGQLCRAGPQLWILGIVPAREALSLAPGGRRRMRRTAEAPSRAAMKLEEALDQLGHEPGRGEVCADLGAAPGGWTQRLVERGAKVIAVDPANLRSELAHHPKVHHVKESAFAFEPEEPVDWLFCDMAWRPLEVAQLLAKWARRGWATHLVANIKLPMNDKNPILWRVRQTLEEAGWQKLRMRQLYHDRDEVTVTARRLG
jgi:23S rRNA (cytidine2498-2'-O)-methyltransferase